MLNELDMKEDIKKVCPSCHGTGIYVGTMLQSELGVLCSECHGKGYSFIKINPQVKLIEENGVVYEVVNNLKIGTINLFHELESVEGIKYVIYGHGGLFTLNFLLSNGITSPYVITYEEFLNGGIPLPIEEYTCPRQITQNPPKDRFDNNCGAGCYSDCENFGKDTCWNKFYENNTSIEDKLNILKRIK